MKGINCKIGDRFGMWIVIDTKPQTTKKGASYVQVQCTCEYKTIQIVTLGSLKSKKSIGCIKCRNLRNNIKFLINIGDRYKEWTVIDGPKYNKYGITLWKIQCSCLQYTRWTDPSYLLNSAKSFKCNKCAIKERRLKAALQNGQIGQLSKSRYNKLIIAAKLRKKRI